MFRNKNFKDKKNYKSFDQWLDTVVEELENEDKKKAQAKREEETKAYEPSNTKTVFRKFSDSKDVKEIFPRNKEKQVQSNTKASQSSTMDQRSHEGKVNAKGSIDREGQMGKEGDPINPVLRKRLEEKRLHKQSRESSPNDKSYKRKSVKKAEKHEKIDSLKREFKDKDQLRKAIILSEILAPPLSNRKKH